MIFGSIATNLNFYLVCSYIFSFDVRDAVTYPIFLLTMIDFLTTGPGYIFCYLAHEFILYHPSNFPEAYISHGIASYEKLRHKVQLLIQQPIVQNIHPFWFGCVPHLFITRLNEYGNGLCALLIAYERYILICKPTKKSTLLSKRRQRFRYVLVTATILLLFGAESFYHYFYRHFTCYYLIQSLENAHFGHLLNIMSNLGFSLLPALICCHCYFCIAKVLICRRKKIGRNLNLILCFATTCAVWVVSLIVKIFPLIYYLVRSLATTDPSMMHDFPLQLNMENLQMVTLLSGLTSLFDPVLIIVSQKDYRKPFYNFWKMIRGRKN